MIVLTLSWKQPADDDKMDGDDIVDLDAENLVTVDELADQIRKKVQMKIEPMNKVAANLNVILQVRPPIEIYRHPEGVVIQIRITRSISRQCTTELFADEFRFQDTSSEELQEYKLYLQYLDGFAVTREHKLAEAKIAIWFHVSREGGVIFLENTGINRTRILDEIHQSATRTAPILRRVCK